MIIGRYALKKRKEILDYAYKIEYINVDEYYSNDNYRNNVYDFYFKKINQIRKYLSDSKLLKSKEDYISSRQEAVFNVCFKYYVIDNYKEHDKIYYSYKEIADFIDDYGAIHNGFSFIEIEVLNIMLDFLECKINLFKDSNNNEYIENDKKIIEHYKNYEYKVNHFGKDIKMRKLQV